MKQYWNRTYHLLLLTAISFGLLAACAIDPVQELDIILHDTYLIVTHRQVVMLLALIALLLWTLYVLTNRLLYSRTLVWIHIIMSIVSLATMTLWLFRPWQLGPHPALRYMAIEDYSTYAGSVRWLLLLVLAGQLLFPINLLAGMVRSFRKKSAGNKN